MNITEQYVVTHVKLSCLPDPIARQTGGQTCGRSALNQSN